MKLLTRELIQDLLSAEQSICLSLYMPTYRIHPEKQQNPIRYKNLVRQMEESLLKKYTPDVVQKYIEPMETLIGDNELWNHTLNGLAVFSADGIFEVVNLHEPVSELAMVADSFHTKPLRQYIQSVDHYHVLAINQHDYRIYEGNRHSLNEVELVEDVPKNLVEALGEELTGRQSPIGSYGNTQRGTASIHGLGGDRKDEMEKDAERFFRVVANVAEERYSKPSGWPMILAALPEHHNLFHKVSKNPYLLKDGITVNPSALSVEQLNTMAWQIMEPEYTNKLDKVVNQFHQAKAHGKGSDDIDDIAVAAVEGRVDTLLVEADRMIAARITNMTSGNIQRRDLENPKIDDLLDDMSELVTKMGGQVMILPPEKMPSESGLAAIFRY
ncbi:MAG: hypothetical protein H7X84_11040 [Verrucomicrobia bacterium]|nr:hypothetical protein [Prolixibacteraceae bacterium]